MSDIQSKLSSAPASAGTGFEHRAAGSCPVAKRMSENFDWISDIERSHLPSECSKNSKTGNFKPDRYIQSKRQLTELLLEILLIASATKGAKLTT